MAEPASNIDDDRSDAFGDELPPGSELAQGQYVIERYLNSGGFGITYLARDSLGRKVVIKECFPGAMCFRTNRTVRLRSRSNHREFQKILDLFETEARALSDLSHPYIVGVHQIFKDNDTAYMALDFVEGCDLLQIIEDDPGLLTPAEVIQLLLKLLDAVAYMHARGILHRDISPDNILIDANGDPVLIDFGAAREDAAKVSRVLSKVLTVKDGYSPQEFYIAGSKQAFSSDLYSLAASFYHLISGTPPPNSHLRLAAAARQTPDTLVPLAEQMQGYDRHFVAAINRCLSIFPQDRLESAEAWRDEIDSERRTRKLLEQAARDKEIDARISQLVSETQREMEATGPAAQPARKAAPPPAPEPKPVLMGPPPPRFDPEDFDDGALVAPWSRGVEDGPTDAVAPDGTRAVSPRRPAGGNRRQTVARPERETAKRLPPKRRRRSLLSFFGGFGKSRNRAAIEAEQ